LKRARAAFIYLNLEGNIMASNRGWMRKNG
jgi:hypothetical protein